MATEDEVFVQRRKDLREGRLQPVMENYDEDFLTFLESSPTGDDMDEFLFKIASGSARVVNELTFEAIHNAIRDDLCGCVFESFQVSSDQNFRQVTLEISGTHSLEVPVWMFSTRMPGAFILNHIRFGCVCHLKP